MLQQIHYSRDQRSHRRLKPVTGNVQQPRLSSRELRDIEVASIAEQAIKILDSHKEAEIAVLGCKRFMGMPLDKVQFYSEPPPNLGGNTRILLSTNWIGHSDMNRLKTDRFACRMPLRRLEIRKILLACGTRLTKQRAEGTVDQTDYFDKLTVRPPVASPIVTHDAHLVIPKGEAVDKTAEFMQSKTAEKEVLLAEKIEHEVAIKDIDKKLADIAYLEEHWIAIQAAMPS